jgi:hypothetical protein
MLTHAARRLAAQDNVELVHVNGGISSRSPTRRWTWRTRRSCSCIWTSGTGTRTWRRRDGCCGPGGAVTSTTSP